jgi:hypothetical protein
LPRNKRWKLNPNELDHYKQESKDTIFVLEFQGKMGRFWGRTKGLKNKEKLGIGEVERKWRDKIVSQ